MDILVQYQETIRQQLQEYTEIPYAYGDLQCRLIIGEDKNNFLFRTYAKALYIGCRSVTLALTHPTNSVHA